MIAFAAVAVCMLLGSALHTVLRDAGSTTAVDDQAVYQVTAPGGLLQAFSPAQRLASRFDRSGVELQSGSLTVGMQLRSFRASGVSTAVTAVMPVNDAFARVSYAHAGITEWYVNGPRGVEQGYTVARVPAGDGSGRLELTIALSGNAQAAMSPDGESVTFTHHRASLRYAGLTAVDADGRRLYSSLALDGSHLRLNVDASGARYPVRVDPLIEQGGKLTGAGEKGDGQFGLGVALSHDGNTALVGAPRDQEFAGAVWAFTRSGGAWSQQGGKLTSGEMESPSGEVPCDEETGEEADECGFGRALAISADGDTALIGAPRVNEGQGAAWIYTRSGGTWTRGQKLVGGGEETKEGHFGRGVALSGDGKTALVGAPGDRSHRGSMWTFTRSGSTWSQSGGKLIPPDGVGQAHFGVSVGLSANGATALVGASGDSSYVGAAWVFTRSGTSWTPQGAKLMGAGEQGAAHLGVSVALSATGDIALIGGRRDNDDVGAAWAFKRTGSSWGQQGAKLTGDGVEANAEFGYSVALSDDGSTALIGAPRDNRAEGAVRQFTRTGDTWTGQPEQLAGAGGAGNPWFGASVALSGDAGTALVGAPHDGARVGGAWAFSDQPFSALAPLVGKVTPAEGPASGGTAVRISGARFTAASAVRFGSLNAASYVVRSSTLIEAVTPPALPGAVDVTVTTPAGTSAIERPNDRFTFTGVPGGGGGGGSGSAAAGGVGGLGVLGFANAASARCQVVVRSKRIAVQSNRAALRLNRTGVGVCSGKLTLRYKVKLKRKRYRLKAIGTAGFSIAPGKSQVVKIKLNAYGRGRLLAGHGRLNASLLMVRLHPSPALGRTASVRLSIKKAPKRPVPTH